MQTCCGSCSIGRLARHNGSEASIPFASTFQSYDCVTLPFKTKERWRQLLGPGRSSLTRSFFSSALLSAIIMARLPQFETYLDPLTTFSMREDVQPQKAQLFSEVLLPWLNTSSRQYGGRIIQPEQLTVMHLPILLTSILRSLQSHPRRYQSRGMADYWPGLKFSPVILWPSIHGAT